MSMILAREWEGFGSVGGDCEYGHGLFHVRPFSITKCQSNCHVALCMSLTLN